MLEPRDLSVGQSKAGQAAFFAICIAADGQQLLFLTAELASQLKMPGVVLDAELMSYYALMDVAV